MGTRIEIEISELDNGWLVEDSFFGYKYQFKTFLEAKKKAIKIFDEFKKEKGY